MSRRWRAALCVIVVSLLPLLVFFPVHRHDFVTFDDGLHIYSNSLIIAPAKEALGRFWGAPLHGLYVPLTYTCWWVQARISDLVGYHGSATVFHIVNLLLHCANTALVFILLRVLGFALVGAVAGALLFGWHPLQVEPVAWISSLKDILSGTFHLLALLFYVRYSKQGRVQRRDYAIAVGCFVLALLAKPAAIVFPLLICILDLFILGKKWQEAWQSWWLPVLIAIPFVWITKSVQPNYSLDFVTPLGLRWVVAGDAVMFYLSKVIFPWFLSLNYGRTPTLVLEQLISYGAWLVVPGTIFLLTRSKARTGLIAGFLVFLAYLLPTLGLIPFYYQRYSTVADRFAYLGLFGVSLAIASVLSTRSKLRLTLAFVAVAWCGLKSSQQLEFWENNRTLIKLIARMNPNDPDVHYSNAILLAEESQGPNGLSYYSHLLRLPPGQSDPKVMREKHEAAIYHFQEAIRLNPKHAFAHNNLGLLFHREGDFEKAAWHFRRSIEIDPNIAEVHNNLGVALAQQGLEKDAFQEFLSSLRLAPENPRAHLNLGLCFEKRGDLETAAKHYRRALKVAPTLADARAKLDALKTRMEVQP